MVKQYSWGPPLIEQQLKESELDVLWKAYDKLDVTPNHDFTEKYNRKVFPIEGRKWFKNTLGYYFDDFIKVNVTHPVSSWDFEGVWMNLFQPSQYIGSHVHNGDISFVIYLKLPNLDPKIENNKLAGWTVFKYGAKTSSRDILQCISHNAIEPKVGKLVIFPANLEHNSMTYYTPEERITISGNITLKI